MRKISRTRDYAPYRHRNSAPFLQMSQSQLSLFRTIPPALRFRLSGYSISRFWGIALFLFSQFLLSPLAQIVSAHPARSRDESGRDARRIVFSRRPRQCTMRGIVARGRTLLTPWHFIITRGLIWNGVWDGPANAENWVASGAGRWKSSCRVALRRRFASTVNKLINSWISLYIYHRSVHSARGGVAICNVLR